MELIAESRSVWIPNHPTEGYVPGRVEETGDDGVLVVVDEHGGKFRVPQAEAQSVDPACLVGVDDLLHLGDFNEAALLHNIRVRYGEDKIYTCIGSPILISVNPYQNLTELYSKAKQQEYRHAGAARASGHEVNIPSHLYAVADAAYRTMLNEQLNQSIIISGESGAGKTEATKRVLAYLAEMQRAAAAEGAPGAGSLRTVEQQVLDANPVLEAFGNAKTVRNDNSSRFGKFIEVEFESSGKLLSAQISNYLLEKSRIVTQQHEERNYHIFYQMCAGVSEALPALAEKLKLTSALDYEYTKICDTIDGVDDGKDFAETIDCMTSLGFSTEERDTVLKIVAAVLHLGELNFTRASCAKAGQDMVLIDDANRAALVCELLGVEVSRFREVLESQTFSDPLSKKIIRRNHTVSSAVFTRHSMAKVAFARLFDWLVWRINESLVGAGRRKKDTRRIGLLDIYGFEVFENNSFEQLCINFANEKLQQHFNTHMFTLEQRLYSSEGIAWSHITFQDNQHIIELLDKRPLGLFCLIDSECIFPKPSDSSLLSKIHQTFKMSKVIYKPSRFESMDFAVAHYAGEVVYNVETFIEKNTDRLQGDIIDLMKTSNMELLKRLFTDERFAPELRQKTAGGDKGNAGARPRTMSRRSTATDNTQQKTNVTVGMNFREQLDKLVEDLNKTNPRYIRCIKPNANKQPREFESIDVLRQLRCAGMLESIRIRRAGYAVRRPFKEFFTRFRTLAPHLTATGADPDYRALCQRLCTEVEQRLRRDGVNLEEKPWQMGQTRLFMKEELERHCERLLVESARHHVIRIQKRWRGYQLRKRFLAMKAAGLQVQALLRTARAMADYREERRRQKAASWMQAALRGLAARSEFLRRRRAAVCVQRFARGWRCRSRLGALKSKAAGAKIRKLREEQERNEALQKAKDEAREKEREMAEMQRQFEEEAQKRRQQDEEAAKQQPPPAELEESTRKVVGLEEENRRLLERLEVAEAAAAAAKADKEAAEAMALADKQVASELERTIAELRSTNDDLQSKMRQLEQQRAGAERRADEATNELRAVLAGQRESGGSGGSRGGGSGGNHAMDALRQEILARIGTENAPNSPTGASTGTYGLLASSLRPAGKVATKDGPSVSRLISGCVRVMDPSSPMNNFPAAEVPSVPLPTVPFHDCLQSADPARFPSRGGHAPAMPASGRLSIADGRMSLTCQRDAFMKLKQQFEEAQDAFNNAENVGDDEVMIPLDKLEGVEQLRQLEEEVRRLRRDNAALKTSALCAQEDSSERQQEATGLIEEMSGLKAELHDVKYRHQGEVTELKQQLEDTLNTLKINTEDLQRMHRRTKEAEERAAVCDSEAKIADSENKARQEQVAQLEKNCMELDQQVAILRKERHDFQTHVQVQGEELDRTRRDVTVGEEERHRERDRLQHELRSKTNELSNVKQVLDDVMSSHVHKDECQKWRTRCETYEREYHKAMRVNHEVTSAVGHMTQAATERSHDVSDLQQRSKALEQENEKKTQALNMQELEKKDLQRQLDNLQSSCDYFQKKYKSTAAEFKALQKEHAVLSEEMPKLRSQVATLMRERQANAGAAAGAAEALRHQQLQQQQQQQQMQRASMAQQLMAEQMQREQLAAAGYPAPGGHAQQAAQKQQQQRHASMNATMNASIHSAIAADLNTSLRSNYG